MVQTLALCQSQLYAVYAALVHASCSRIVAAGCEAELLQSVSQSDRQSATLSYVQYSTRLGGLEFSCNNFSFPQDLVPGEGRERESGEVGEYLKN